VPLIEMPTATQWSREVHTTELSVEMGGAVGLPRAATSPCGVRMVVVVEAAAELQKPSTTAVTADTISFRTDLDRSEATGIGGA
jgi:hypothetical protein